MVPLPGDQAFTCEMPMKTVSFKPPQSHSDCSGAMIASGLTFNGECSIQSKQQLDTANLLRIQLVRLLFRLTTLKSELQPL